MKQDTFSFYDMSVRKNCC